MYNLFFFLKDQYVVPPVTAELIDKMEVQLEDSSNRIGNTGVNGDQIDKHLQGLINELKVQQTFPFTSNINVYTSPPKKANAKFEFTPEQEVSTWMFVYTSKFPKWRPLTFV